jgi:hypothetical protein
MSLFFMFVWFVLPWVVVWYRNKRNKTWDEVMLNRSKFINECVIALVVSGVGLVLLFIAAILAPPTRK